MKFCITGIVINIKIYGLHQIILKSDTARFYLLLSAGTDTFNSDIEKIIEQLSAGPDAIKERLSLNRDNELEQIKERLSFKPDLLRINDFDNGDEFFDLLILTPSYPFEEKMRINNYKLMDHIMSLSDLK